MYAVIQTGGKQYRVQPGDTVQVEKLPGRVGEAVDFGEVLLISDDARVTIGKPLVQGALVKATITEHGRDAKLIVYKFRAKKNYRRKNGHRQSFTAVRVDRVVNPA